MQIEKKMFDVRLYIHDPTHLIGKTKTTQNLACESLASHSYAPPSALECATALRHPRSPTAT